MKKIHAGDKLYSLVWERDGTQSIWEEEITDFRCDSHGKVVYYMTESGCYTPREIGNNVYLKEDEVRRAYGVSRERGDAIFHND